MSVENAKKLFDLVDFPLTITKLTYNGYRMNVPHNHVYSEYTGVYQLMVEKGMLLVLGK